MGKTVLFLAVLGGCSAGGVALPSGDMANAPCVYELTEPAASGVCTVSVQPFAVHIELASGAVDVMADKSGGHVAYAGCSAFTGAVVFNDMPAPAWDFDLDNGCSSDATVRVAGHVHGVMP